MPFTYILECADGSLYVGSTRNLQRRVLQHQQGQGAAYTSKRRPVQLVWAHEFEHVGEAFSREKQIQNWSQAKRRALINGDWEQLRQLSRRRGRPGE